MNLLPTILSFLNFTIDPVPAKHLLLLILPPILCARVRDVLQGANGELNPVLEPVDTSEGSFDKEVGVDLQRDLHLMDGRLRTNAKGELAKSTISASSIVKM